MEEKELKEKVKQITNQEIPYCIYKAREVELEDKLEIAASVSKLISDASRINSDLHERHEILTHLKRTFNEEVDKAILESEKYLRDRNILIL